jgi:hypothetical protein
LQAKHEVLGESADVATNGLNQRARLDAVELCKILVEHHLFRADDVDALLNRLDGNHDGCRRYQLTGHN